MSKCDSKGFVIKADQIGKLKNEDLIAISVLDDLASCAKLDTRNVDANKGNVENLKSVYYNAANVPDDVIGCSKNKCYNTGSLQGEVKTDNTAVVFGNFYKYMDALQYTVGTMVAYFWLPAGNHTVTVDITEYTEQAWDNYDSVATKIHATKEGFYLAKFDLTAAKQTATGNGWNIDQIGVKLRFRIDGANLKVGNIVGISSIAFYESIEDLELNNTILLSCIDTWGDSQSFDVIEGACSVSEYDPQSGTMTANITTNKYTENLRYLNPTLHKSDDTTFGVMKVVTREVLAAKDYFARIDEALAEELKGYGVIQLSDAIEDCGFVYVQTPGCANNAHSLTRVNSPIPVMGVADADKFQVLTSNYKGDFTRGLVLVGKDWIGQSLNVVYRKEATAEVYEVTNEFRDFNVNILAPLRKKDGTIEYHYYENAFVTTLNNNISRSDETTVELQFTIAADENGVRKKIAKITEA